MTITSRIVGLVAGLAVLSSASLLVAQDPLRVRASEGARTLGIERYEMFLDEHVGAEIVDRIELVGAGGEPLGHVTGGELTRGLYGGYTFSLMELAGHLPFTMLSMGGNTMIYVNGELRVHAQVSPETGGVLYLEDHGLDDVAGTAMVFDTVLEDEAVRRVLERGYIPPQEANDEDDVEDCPPWVVVGSCTLCVACAPAAEIPPGCISACATCAYCGFAVLEDLEAPPLGEVNGGDGLPNCLGNFCFAGETLVHVPGGTTPISALAAGDAVFSLDQQSGRMVVATVTEVQEHSGDFALVAVDVGGDHDPVLSTPGHAFMTPAGWRVAVALQGRDVLTRSGGWAPSEVEPAAERVVRDVVYNLSLDHTGGFFVGSAGAYVSSNSAR